MITFSENQRLELAILVEDMIATRGLRQTTKTFNFYPITVMSICDAEDSGRYDHIVEKLRAVFPAMNSWSINWNGKPYKLSQLEWPQGSKVAKGCNFLAKGKQQPRVAAAQILSKPGKRAPIAVERSQDLLKKALSVFPNASISLNQDPKRQGEIIIYTGEYI